MEMQYLKSSVFCHPPTPQSYFLFMSSCNNMKSALGIKRERSRSQLISTFVFSPYTLDTAVGKVNDFIKVNDLVKHW